MQISISQSLTQFFSWETTLVALFYPLICVLLGLDLWRKGLKSHEGEEAIWLAIHWHHQVVLKMLSDLSLVDVLLSCISRLEREHCLWLLLWLWLLSKFYCTLLAEWWLCRWLAKYWLGLLPKFWGGWLLAEDRLRRTCIDWFKNRLLLLLPETSELGSGWLRENIWSWLLYTGLKGH